MRDLNQSSTLAPFIRSGIDGGCMACLRPIADHVDSRGQWLGCRGTREDVPLILIPDRRALAAPAPPQAPEPRQERRQTGPTPAPARRQLAQERVSQAPARPHVATGPQVLYLARYPVTDRAIDRLPPHDRKVYGQIARMRGKGATRAFLLDAIDAQKHTGRVDGAIRRLRLRKVITVRPISE